MCLTPYVQPCREHTYRSVLNRAKFRVFSGESAERRLLALLEDRRRAAESGSTWLDRRLRGGWMGAEPMLGVGGARDVARLGILWNTVMTCNIGQTHLSLLITTPRSRHSTRRRYGEVLYTVRTIPHNIFLPSA